VLIRNDLCLAKPEVDLELQAEIGKRFHEMYNGERENSDVILVHVLCCLLPVAKKLWGINLIKNQSKICLM
jgi:hypothetical protein